MSNCSPYVRLNEVRLVLDVGRTKYYEPGGVRSHPKFPRTINIPGIGRRKLRRELEEFAELLAIEATATAPHAPSDQHALTD